MLLRFEKLGYITYVNTDNMTKATFTKRDITFTFVDGTQKEFIIKEDISEEQVKALLEQLDSVIPRKQG
ncbi:MAG: hypothetical protein AB1765_13270 [Candidatus Hydrogenedentota bacterium]